MSVPLRLLALTRLRARLPDLVRRPRAAAAPAARWPAADAFGRRRTGRARGSCRPRRRLSRCANRRRPGARGVRAVQRAGVLIVEAERVHHVEDEESAHAVVAEALPHLGEEESGEAARVSEKTAGRRHHRSVACGTTAKRTTSL